MFGAELLAAGKDDDFAVEQGPVPAGRRGLEAQVAGGGEGSAGEGGERRVLAAKVDGDVADDLAGLGAGLVIMDEAIGRGGLDHEELPSAAVPNGERAGDGGAIAVGERDADRLARSGLCAYGGNRKQDEGEQGTRDQRHHTHVTARNRAWIAGNETTGVEALIGIRRDGRVGETEHILTGGNVTVSVVRIGTTVRKPATIATAGVTAFLRFLQDAGFSGSPRHLGFDEQGRQVLEFIPGHVGAGELPFGLPDLRRIGKLIREFHDCSATYAAPPSTRWERAMTPDREEIICHNDLAPWNFVRSAERWVFLDWDGAGPGSRLWDLAYAAIAFAPIELTGDAQRIARRIRALGEGYVLMRERAIAMRELLIDGGRTGREPWARLYKGDHAAYWDDVATFVEQHLRTLEQGLLNRLLNLRAEVAVVDGLGEADPDVEQAEAGDHAAHGAAVEDAGQLRPGKDERVVIPDARPPGQHSDKDAEVDAEEDKHEEG